MSYTILPARQKSPDALAKVRRLPRINFVLLPALLILAADAITKHLALSLLTFEVPQRLGPLTLLLQTNVGNVLNEHAMPISHVLLSRAPLIIVAIGWLWFLSSKLAAVASGLIIGGVVGNILSDLFAPHAVPDFLLVGNYVCNLADLSIVTGCFLVGLALAISSAQWLHRYTTQHSAKI
jgi:lipoprotein signal peptidase